MGQGLRVDTDANGQLSYCGVDLADQRAPARRLAAMDGHGNTAGGQGRVSGHDFTDAMRRATGVALRAHDVVVQPRNRLARWEIP